MLLGCLDSTDTASARYDRKSHSQCVILLFLKRKRKAADGESFRFKSSRRAAIQRAFFLKNPKSCYALSLNIESKLLAMLSLAIFGGEDLPSLPEIMLLTALIQMRWRQSPVPSGIVPWNMYSHPVFREFMGSVLVSAAPMYCFYILFPVSGGVLALPPILVE